MKKGMVALTVILGFFLSGCGDGDTEEKFPELASRYTANNIIMTLKNCSDTNDNGAFTFDDAIWTISNQTGTQFDSTITLTKILGGVELKTTVIASGNIDENGNFSGTFSSVFTVDGVSDSSGDGTFDGTLKGDTAIMNFVDNDKVGDTCIATGTIVFAENKRQNPGTFPGVLDLSGPDASILGGKFTVNVIPIEIGQFVTWQDFQTISQTRTVSGEMQLTLNLNGTVKEVAFQRFDIDSGIPKTFSTLLYILSCNDRPLDCTSILVDSPKKTITFSNTPLAVRGGIQVNDATAPLVITGTLFW